MPCMEDRQCHFEWNLGIFQASTRSVHWMDARMAGWHAGWPNGRMARWKNGRQDMAGWNDGFKKNGPSSQF